MMHAQESSPAKLLSVSILLRHGARGPGGKLMQTFPKLRYSDWTCRHTIWQQIHEFCIWGHSWERLNFWTYFSYIPFVSSFCLHFGNIAASETTPFSDVTDVCSQWNAAEYEQLTPIGHEMIKFLGRWFAQKYSKRFPIPRVMYRCSKSGRAMESGDDFIKGFNDAISNNVRRKFLVFCLFCYLLFKKILHAYKASWLIIWPSMTALSTWY